MKEGSSFAVKKGTLIALACGAAFAAPQAAMAQLTLPKVDGHAMTISGHIGGGVGYVTSSGATAGETSNTVGRTVVTGGDNDIRWAGSSKLNNPMFKGWGWQVEAGFDTDTGESGSSAGILFSRNTGVGVDTPVGVFWTGKWDTPYKRINGANSVTGTATGVSASVSGIRGNQGMGGGGGGVTKTANVGDAMNFDRRQTNTMNWASPQWAGARIALQYSPDEETGAGSVPEARPRLYGAAIEYRNGPLYLGWGYEEHRDFRWGQFVTLHQFGPLSPAAGVGTHSRDTANVLSAQYTFGNTHIRAGWEELRYRQGGGTALMTHLETEHYLLGVRQNLGGPHQVSAQYVKAKDYDCEPSNMCGTDTGADQFNLLYGYRLDSNATIYVFWGRVKNDSQGNWKPSGSASSVSETSSVHPAGKKYTGYSVVFDSSF